MNGTGTNLQFVARPVWSKVKQYAKIEEMIPKYVRTKWKPLRLFHVHVRILLRMNNVPLYIAELVTRI